MKMIILGNGFDLASGLPTSYKDYFEYRVKQKSKDFDQILSLLIFSYKSQARKNYNNFKLGYDENNMRLTRMQLEKSLEDAVKDDYAKALNLYSEKVNDLVNHSINFWDIYFWIMERENYMIKDNWSDVEDKISGFLSVNDRSAKININHYPFIKDIIDFRPDSIYLLDDKYFDNIMFSANKIDRMRFMIQQFINHTNDNDDKTDLYSYFLDQLELFENNFKNYIKKILDEFVNNIRSNLNIYRNNLVKLIDGDLEDAYFLINFNYTGFSISSKEKTNISSRLTFQRNHQEISISEMNVHGRSDKRIIFGIDQTKIDATKPEYIFTKTYRKISSAEELSSFALPLKNKLDEIVFYGHSLSQADYSYFQSIFDYYEIYNSNIKLKFLYSLYGSPDQHKVIKTDKLKSVTSLVQSYGNSMNNKDNGKNLVHKLLLENRLEVKQISLDKIGMKKVPDILSSV
jgi:hypothetical protein